MIQLDFWTFEEINMRKKTKDFNLKSRASDKIEINKAKIYRISDPIQLATVFYPAKNANLKRAAFLAIFFELKNTRGQKLGTTAEIHEKYNLSRSGVVKVRVKMVRIGLICKRDGYWRFSSSFFNALERLTNIIDKMQMPAQSQDERDKEKTFVEIAKGLK